LKFGLGGNLWANKDFIRLWTSETISQFGTQFSQFSIPVLAVLAFQATSLEMGILIALSFLPFPLLGLFVGVWADRFRKRRIMIVCNLGRMAVLASVPVGYLVGVLSLYQLFAVVFLNGVFTVFFDIAYQSYLPFLVEKEGLLEGNQKLQTSESVSQVVGPTLAGFVYQLVGGALSIVVDVVGYLFSALSLASIRKEEPAVDAEGTPRNFFGEMKEGIVLVFRNPLLATTAACTATTNLGGNIVLAVLTIFALSPDYLKFTPVAFGIIGTLGAVGFLLGVLTTRRITGRLGLGPTLAVAIGLTSVYVLDPIALVAFPFFVLSAVAMVINFSVPLYNINQVSLRQAITPHGLQGRMNATVRTLVWGTIPLGSVVGGVLGEVLGVVNTIYVGGAISGLFSGSRNNLRRPLKLRLRNATRRP
jgi:MFS family permease